MRKVAVCLKPQQANYIEGNSIWRHFPVGITGIKTMNYAISFLEEGDTELIVFIMAPLKYVKQFQELFCWGVSKVVYISDPLISGADSLGTAKVLSAAVERYECNIVIIGNNSEDSSTGQVPMQVAMALDAQFYLDKNGGGQSICRDNKIVIAVDCNCPETFPNLMTIQNGLGKEVDIISLKELGLETVNLKYTDVVGIKQVEMYSRKNQFEEMTSKEAADLLSQIFEVNNNE